MRQTILVVDHELSARRQIARLLSRTGFQTFEAETPAQALALVDASDEPIDLAIIDVAIPQLGGLDIAAELGRQQPAIQFLYLSSHSSSIAVDCIRHRSPELLLLKPFTEQDLIDRVFGLLGITTASTPLTRRSASRSAWRPIPD